MAIQAKYTFNVGGGAYGMKGEYIPGGKITLYDGFESVYFSDPRSTVTLAPRRVTDTLSSP